MHATPIVPVILPNKQLFRLDEVALLMSVHVSSVRRWMDDGQVPFIRLPGGHRRIPRKSVEALVAQRRD